MQYMQYLDFLTNKQAQEIANKGDEIFGKLPHLPKGVVNFFVAVAPWLALIGGILGVLGSLQGLLGWNTMNKWFAMAGITQEYMMISSIISLVTSVIALLSFMPLKERKIEGWMLVFWNMILGVVSTIVGIVMIGSNIVWSVFWTFVGFYIVYEMKSKYNGKKSKK